MGAPRGVVSLSWTLGGTTVPLQAPQRSTNPDGLTEDVMVAISATPSADPYVCVAILPATTRRQATMSVTVNAAPILIATTTDSVMTTNVTAFAPEPINIKAIVIPVVIIFIIVLVVVVILIFIKCFNIRVWMMGYRRPKSKKLKNKGIISYFELEKLVEKFSISSLSLIVAELIDDSKRELEPECTKADLYKYLCEWKESSSGRAILLSSAMEKYDLENEILILEVQKEHKSELTDKVLKEFALSITERHCQRLGKTLKLSADTIATRNEEDLKMFRTDDMLKAWGVDQKCSNYEIRRRLRQAAEECNRQDIADNFFSKEQSEVMTPITELPVCLTITNEKQSHGASASGSKDKSGNSASSQSAPHSSHGDLNKIQSSVAQPTSNIADFEDGFVSDISRDELARIGRYAGSSMLLAFCKRYGVTEIPEQQSPEGKELPFETKIINVLKPTLDSEREKYREGWKLKEAPREILRQLLQDKHPRYACLLAKGKPAEDIFNVELIDLAFRLIMADVYPFAIALNISDQVLTSYRRNIGSHKLTPDTVKIMKQVYTDDRFKLVRALKQAGYSEEARALHFGFEISFGDVVEVQNRVDKVQLAKQLGVSDDVQSTEPDSQGKDDTLHQSVLLRWRDTVRSSTFNHRLVLADALFRMDEEQLALDIISEDH
eukprot:XP_011673695.1 PREDICTED: uncharacterized protein LOC105442815 [Strongylocentrotus purpuratus]